MKAFFLIISLLAASSITKASYLLVPMDSTQANHLKAYGSTFWAIQNKVEAEWLLNYKGGSFMFKHVKSFKNKLTKKGVSYSVISDEEALQIKETIARPASNMDIIRLEVAPKLAVYSPKSKQPWDDAVTLVLNYAEIPYDVIFDDEVMLSKLADYDWLHLHHEDFTGQYGKFYATYGRQEWYIEQQSEFEKSAQNHGFNKVSELKLAVAKKIKEYCAGGGFLFAMCSATDTYDIALSVEGVDICDEMYDGDPFDKEAQSKLNYENTFAFTDFKLKLNAYEYEYSNIDNQSHERGLNENNDFFKLREFSVKSNPVEAMLTQNHELLIKGFMGQTTAFKKVFIKPDVVILGETEEADEARYIYGTFDKGTWAFFGGHDPEDYRHFVGEETTDLNLHPNSPGYRLILNNILFTAAKKIK